MAMKKLILLSCVLSTLLLANDTTTEPLPDDLKLSLGAYIIGDNKSLFKVEGHDGVSGAIDLQKVLKMDTDVASLYFDGYYRFTPHHRIEFGYKGIFSSGHASAGAILFPGDHQIDLRGEVNSKFNLQIAKLLYTYSFYHNEDVELGLSIGVHRTAIDFDLGATVGTSGSEFKLVIAPPIPVLGVRFDYNIYPEWDVLFSYDLIALVADVNLPESPHIDGISGHMTDMNIATEYRFFDNFSAGAAVNYNNLSFNFIRDDFDVGIDNRIVGFALYGSFRY